MFNCTRSPSNDRFLTKETCADENKDQRVGETVSFASLVVLSFQYLSRKKKTRNGGWREGNDPFAATNKKKQQQILRDRREEK